jgi:hypothetical protein
MARNKGTFSYAANYEVKIQALLDPRGGVETREELINKETFPYDGDTIYMKEGMLVTVSSTQEVYMLVSLANILATDYSGWKRVDAGAVTPVEIIDNLTSDDTDKALSAKQGKVLMGEIGTIKTKISTIYTPKGSKETYAELPTDAEPGDVWDVKEAHDGYPAGTNYVWVADLINGGGYWDALGGAIDLSNYYNKTEVAGEIKKETDRADAEEKRLAGLIDGVSGTASGADNKAGQALSLAKQNETNIAAINLVLNGNNNPDDDITDTVGLVGRLEAVETLIGEATEDDKTSTMLSRLNALEALVTGGDSGEGEGDQTLLQKVNQNKLEIAALKTTVYGENNNGGLVKAIALLNDVSTVEGSVDYKIAQAFAWVDVQ